MADRQLTYFIYLTDAATVATLQAQYPKGVVRAPEGAAVEFGAPYQSSSTPFEAPCTRTDGNTPPSGQKPYPTDVATFTRDSGGFWGWLPFVGDVRYVWVGYFLYAGAAQTSSTPPVGAMGQRKFINGFAYGMAIDPSGEGSFRLGGERIARLGRFPESFAYSPRSDTANAPVFEVHNADELGVALTPDFWERMYIRITRLGVSDAGFWMARSDDVNHAVAMRFNTSGAIVVSGLNVAGTVETQMGVTGVLPLGSVVRLDILGTMKLSGGNNQLAVRVYFNKVAQSASDWTHTTGGNPGTRVHKISGLNTWYADAAGFQFEIMDWVSIKPAVAHTQSPSLATVEPTGVDWNHGSRIVYSKPRAYDATMSGWTGDIRVLMGQPIADETVSSSTPLGLLAVQMDADYLWREVPGAMGIASMIVGCYTTNAVAGSGRLGFAFNGGSTTYKNITEAGGVIEFRTVGYVPSGLMLPEQVTSLLVVKEKANDANASTAGAMLAAAEFIGTFGPEDVDPDAVATEIPAFLPHPGHHNAPYPRTQWNRSFTRPDSPVVAISGTYVGNGTGQDLHFRAPVHYFQTRQADHGSAGWVRWWSSMIWDHESAANDIPAKNAPVHVMIDPEYVSGGGDADSETRTVVRIVGSQVTSNQNGVTYQYVAFCDPGNRHCLNGSVRVDQTLGDGQQWALRWDSFTPIAGLFWSERQFTNGPQTLYKGPGHALAAASQFDAAESNPAIEFGPGIFKTSGPAHIADEYQQLAYSVWRTQLSPESTDVVVQILSYVGDGTASRTIALTPLSGRRPMLAWVTPHDAATYFRDPSMTTNRSYLENGTVSTTAITGGGIDQITVGATLNSNGIVYDVFVLPGCDGPGNGGWSVNCEKFYAPVPAPDYPEGYTPEELEDELNPPSSDGFDDGPTLEDDLALEDCIPFTLRVCNLALARIGVSDRIRTAADLIPTPVTKEADLIVQFYEHVIRKVLRDFVWNHATRYQVLTLIDGSFEDPVNGDWPFAFRAPTAMLKARRIIRQNIGRDYDGNPPDFRLGADDVGPLIYFKEWDPDEVDVELEYTIRPVCAARAAGNQTFVSCVAWRLAAELSPPLTRDEKITERCWREYKSELPKGAADDAQELQQPPPGEAPWIDERG